MRKKERYSNLYSISIAGVFGLIVEVFVMIVSDDTFLVNAALIRVLFGLDKVEVIFELVRGDFLIGFGLDIFDVF